MDARLVIPLALAVVLVELGQAQFANARSDGKLTLVDQEGLVVFPIESPTQATRVRVAGIAVEAESRIVIDGGVSSVAVEARPNHRFKTYVDLHSNMVHTLTVTEIDADGSSQPTVEVEVVQDSESPIVVIDSPSDGAIINDLTADVVGHVDEPLSGFAGLLVTVNGRSATVDATTGVFIVQDVSLTTHFEPTIQVLAEDAAGNIGVTSITVSTDIVTNLVETSPSDGEGGVALTRETILVFDRPLSVGHVPPGAIIAEFGGETLPAQRHVSQDGQRVTLFYDATLPPSATIRVSVDGEVLRDYSGRRVDADGDGLEGGVRVFEFSTLSTTIVPGTAVCGRVFASELADGINVPLQGVEITVDGDQSLSAITDEMGNFRLEPAPAGRFFVHIDGRTAVGSDYPGSAYYPNVGKAWDPIPGQETNVGEIFLPIVLEGALQDLSLDHATVISFVDAYLNDFPELAGTEVVVPARSLFFDDGSPGTQLGIAPVSPDRLPGELPPGLELPLVVTVQTDGATNFDTPVPVVFPNLPDPETNEPLPAGSKSALWSFDHDVGRWRVVGPMTVTDDGAFVVSDAGFGIVAPGWHGTRPGTSGTGGGGGRTPCDALHTDANNLVKCVVSQLLDELKSKMKDNIIQFIFDTTSWSLGCAISVTENSIQDIVDCLQNQQQCIETGTWERIWNITKDCLPYYSDAVTSIQNLQKLKNTGGDLADCVGQLLPLVSQDHLQARLDLQLQILTTSQAVFLSVVDDPRWANVLDYDEMPDLVAALEAATHTTSESGEFIDTVERIEILATDRPGPVTTADIEALVDRLNLTTTMWGNGTPTHASAGRDGFVDAQELLDALFVFQSKIDQAQTAGWVSSMEVFKELISGHVFNEMVDIVGDSFEPITHALYYKLTNITSGFVERGLLQGAAFSGKVLAENSLYQIAYLDPGGLQTAYAIFATRGSGTSVEIPRAFFGDPDPLDSDDDGISDEGESIVGTDPTDPDTDGDGVNDAAEIVQGTNPLDGVAVQVGILASIDTPGTAVDVDTFDDTAVVADGESGVSVFNVFNGMDPIVVAQIDTVDAVAVALSDEHIVVADGSGGALVIDIRGLPEAEVLYRLPLSGTALAVAVAGDAAYVGFANGALVAIDVNTGVLLGLVNLVSPVRDISAGGDVLYALTTTTLHALPILDVPLQVSGTASMSSAAFFTGSRRLFVGDGHAFATRHNGYDVFDLSDPRSPVLCTVAVGPQNAWRQVALNGSGEGIATVGVQNPSADSNIELYDLSNPTEFDLAGAFLGRIITPGRATAVSIFNGLAYVADENAGLQVVNYLAYDSAGIPPGISVTIVPGGPQIEEGRTLVVSASVEDDSQVRNVELLLDGSVVANDGNYPFEFFVPVPSLNNQEALSIAARAFDTGGNNTTSEETVMQILPDSTSPTVASLLEDGAPISHSQIELNGLQFGFSEEIDPATLDSNSVLLTGAGADRQFGTPDDLSVMPSVELSLGRILSVLPDGGAPCGAFQVLISGGIRDLAGNMLDGNGDGQGGDTFELVVDVGNQITGLTAHGWPRERTSNRQPPFAVDSSTGTFTWTTESSTTDPVNHLGVDIGFPAIVERIRLWKDSDIGVGGHVIGPKDLVIQYTTGVGPMSERTWTNVTNLTNGFLGRELMVATAVNPEGTVDADVHDSVVAGHGWASLTFDQVLATGLRISFSNIHPSLPWNHYKVHEFQVHSADCN